MDRTADLRLLLAVEDAAPVQQSSDGQQKILCGFVFRLLDGNGRARSFQGERASEANYPCFQLFQSGFTWLRSAIHKPTHTRTRALEVERVSGLDEVKADEKNTPAINSNQADRTDADPGDKRKKPPEGGASAHHQLHMAA